MLKRLVDGLAGPARRDMAKRMGRFLTAQMEASDRGDLRAAGTALLALDAAILKFVKEHDANEVYASVSHWAAHLATEGEVLRIAAYFANSGGFRDVVQALGQEGGEAGGGLLLFQEGLNESGIVMSPSLLDSMRARSAKEREPEPTLDLEQRIAALAELLWPESDAEKDLRKEVARLAGVEQHIAAWELFALRAHGFTLGSRIAFGEREDRQEVLEKAVHRLIEPRVRGLRPMDDPKRWNDARQQRYLQALEDSSANRQYGSVRWLEEIRKAFQESLGKDDARLGQIGGAEFDRVLIRSQDLCAGMKSL